MAEFNYVDLDELDELRGKTHKEVMERVLAGWNDLIDENGDQVPFNVATKKALYVIPQAFEALVKGFWESIYGAKRGN
ncbi:hypothetical protein ACFQUU_08785 [Herbaspirillum sp. GCM10030257]|uniref:hypothetical protein n=1 Tax=Herbaspirillum sp. GCM10030257 TaxID=3273393 RepID=UPI0036175B89